MIKMAETTDVMSIVDLVEKEIDMSGIFCIMVPDGYPVLYRVTYIRAASITSEKRSSHFNTNNMAHKQLK